MRAFWLAWQFLTRLPAPSLASVSEREVGQSQAFYPLIGLVIGALLYAAAHLIQTGALSATVVAVLVLLVWVGVTGGLHLDGLADVADAWIGAHGDRERALAIMKDPASGPMGVSTLLLLLLLKFALLQQLLLGPTQQWLVLLLIPALARALVPLMFLTLTYLRPAGLGRALADHLPTTWVAFSWSLLLLAGGFTLGWWSLWLWISALALWGILRHLFLTRFGGLTGDMVGAAIELNEALLLLIALLAVMP